MSLATIDDLLVGMLPPYPFQKTGTTMEAAGVYHSTWYSAGTPGAASAPSPGAAGVALESPITGQIPFPATVSGKDIYVGRIDWAQSGSLGRLLLLDRLLHNSGLSVTSTGSQTVNSVTLPPRDRNGSTNGEGVQVALEISTATTQAGAQTMTVTYTNSAGTGSRTGTIAIPATAQIGTFATMVMQAGDTGVRSIQSVQLSATLTAGAIHLVMYREIASCPSSTAANVAMDRDALQLGLPRAYNLSVPWLVGMPSATTATSLWGSVSFIQA